MKRRPCRVASALLVLALGVGGCMFFSGTEAVIEVDVVTGVVPLTIAFDGTGSTANSGISTYHWWFGTEDESTDATGTYTYDDVGEYTLTLTVRSESGKSDTAHVTITVEPAIWITDRNLDRIHKLDMQGGLERTIDLAYSEPTGVTLAEVNGATWLFVACFNGGSQRILRVNPVTGEVAAAHTAPAQSPLQITYGAWGQKQLWHVDGLSRKIYRINPPDGHVYEAYGQTYFKATSPQVTNVTFLQTPQGLDWTSAPNAPGYLWYLEGETHLLYRIEIIPGYDIMSNTQLQVEGDAVELPSEIFPVGAIDIVDDVLWAIDVNNHRLVEIDLETGELTGTEIYGFPGSAPAGLEVQQ